MEKTLGTRIAELRREKGMKQDALAEKLGVSPQAVSKWENDVSCPDIMLVPRLAKELGVTTDLLLSGDEAAEDPEMQLIPEKNRKSFDDMILRIKVDGEDGVKARVNLPLPLVKVFVDAGIPMESFGTVNGKKIEIDWQKIMLLIENGVVGKLVEVDTNDGIIIEVVVE